MNSIKGLTMTFVFEAESANYGEGIGNVTSLKKLSRDGGRAYTYISRQALRYNIINQMGCDNTPLDLYKDVIKKYGIKDVVVGSIFSEERSEETVHFSDKGLLFYNPNSDESQIKKQLMQLGNVRVFSRSSQVTQYYKEKTKDIER